ncbi:MAG: type I-E CRISPR-associated protein Cas5/CasD [Planctomycetes bacterium]|nr:type I-E CRISPR-associated protein Cas5/CasD [Planctomycetota bacterium]MCW8134423.1 type I-E CRISPR-associated protein Cas5/CasD [Planctomycetota bacterium]
MPDPHTLFLRLEGPLQAWGDTNKFVIRRTMEAPTKSGVLGLIACAMGVTRGEVRECYAELNSLCMGVRIDRPGILWWDYHTVGARTGVLKAEGGVKRNAKTKEPETLITRREYLADASFLVALRGDKALIDETVNAMHAPKWSLFLGRKSCPPSVPPLVLRSLGEGRFEPHVEHGVSLVEALKRIPWQPRFKNLQSDKPPKELACILEWRPTEAEPEAPDAAEVWYDVPVAYTGVAPVHQPRFVTRCQLTLGKDVASGDPLFTSVPRPSRPRADYTSTEWKKRRGERLRNDHGLCVFCKQPATTVQHISYRHAGGNEDTDKELASLCRLCHDTCTMLEYGLGMTLDRIDPTDPKWRDRIIEKRTEIREFRSVEGRRRTLARAPGTDKPPLQRLDDEED